MEISKKYGKTKLACYLGFINQAICANFAPLLFLRFHDIYGITLGKLALIPTCFFFTQLITDLVCAKFVDKIGYRKCVVASSAFSFLGLAGLSFLPEIFPSPFAGILAGVIIYAVGSGLIEVLGSPIIEACPFENKDKMMSLLHSFYCWGSAGVIVGSTLFFTFFGIENWRLLTLIWSILPLYNIYNFAVCPIEKITEEGESMTVGQLLRTKIFWLFIILMVCAGASELSMSQWASAFAEAALHVSKTAGDLAGPCGFAVCMAISRTLYGKYGDKMDLTVFMFFSGILCLVCYLLAGLADIPVMGLVGCAVCGFSVGIMWPGSISISSSVLPAGGTAMFALLALAGDLGGSAGPAIVGAVSQNSGDDLRSGILAGCVFPVVLVICVLILRKKQIAEK